MRRVALIVIDSTDESELNGMINAIEGTIKNREAFAEHYINADCTWGLINADKALRAIAKENITND